MLGPSNHNHPLLSHSRPLISEGGNKLIRENMRSFAELKTSCWSYC